MKSEVKGIPYAHDVYKIDGWSSSSLGRKHLDCVDTHEEAVAALKDALAEASDQSQPASPLRHGRSAAQFGCFRQAVHLFAEHRSNDVMQICSPPQVLHVG